MVGAAYQPGYWYMPVQNIVIQVLMGAYKNSGQAL